MDTNKNKNDATNGLGRLLLRVRVPVKTELEWQRLENDLFLKLDEQAVPRRSKAFSIRFGLPRFGVAWAAAAALIAVTLFGGGITVAWLTQGFSPSFAGIESVRGNVTVTWPGKGAAQSVTSQDKGVFDKEAPAGTAIAVAANSSAIIRLDKGSALELLPGSRLVIKKASASQQVCFLSSGSVLVKVNKRAKGQHFEVATACASCRVVGTAFRVDAFDGSKTALSVYQGRVMLVPSRGVRGNETLVETGRELTVSRNIGPVGRRLSATAAPIHDISVLGMLADDGTDGQSVLEVTSKPDGAKVMIDGAMAGVTPLLVKKPQGAYSIAVFSDGCSISEQTVTLGGDRFATVHATLSHAPEMCPSAPSKKPRAVAVGPRRQGESELTLIPEYVEALVNISGGEYQRAIGILDSLWKSGVVDIKGRMCLMEKVNACYAKLGDFNKAAEALEEKYEKAQTPGEKGQLLWEMATMRANCLGDYQGAEMALVEFLILQPNALWAHQAYSRLAEIQYYLNKFEIAAETYKKHIATFPDDPDIDRSMYNLACILQQDLGKCEKAARWYSRLIDSFQTGKYRAAAFFRRGECELRMGKTAEAQRDFNNYLKLEPEGMWRETCITNVNKLKNL